jgi:hypothetical protein
MGEFAIHTRIEVFVAAAAAVLAGVAQPAEAQPAAALPAAPAEASASVPREVLERYVGRYELNGAILTRRPDRRRPADGRTVGATPGAADAHRKCERVRE